MKKNNQGADFENFDLKISSRNDHKQTDLAALIFALLSKHPRRRSAPFSKHSPLRNMMRRITIMSVMVMICFTKTASSGLNLRKKKIDIDCWGCNGSNNRADN